MLIGKPVWCMLGLWLLPFTLLAATAVQIETGRQIVSGETALPRCARCHGERGEGNLAEAAPRLAGQSGFYLEQQLRDFAAGLRPSAIMQPIAEQLDVVQRAAVAAYFEAQRDVPYPPPPPVDPLLLQQGGALAGAGDPARGIRACVLCHAYGGSGIPPAFPYLAGQHADYTAQQLRLWQRGLRRNDPLDVMAEIAEQLSGQEMAALALYFARVRLPLSEINDLTPAEPVP